MSPSVVNLMFERRSRRGAVENDGLGVPVVALVGVAHVDADVRECLAAVLRLVR